MPQRQQPRVRLLELAVTICPNGQMTQASGLSLVAPVQSLDAVPQQRQRGIRLKHNDLLDRIRCKLSAAPTASARLHSVEHRGWLHLRPQSNPYHRLQTLYHVLRSNEEARHIEISWLQDPQRQQRQPLLSEKVAMAPCQKNWRMRPTALPAAAATWRRARARNRWVVT